MKVADDHGSVGTPSRRAYVVLALAGTWVPATAVAAFIAIVLYQAVYGPLTWERPIAYVIGGTSLSLAVQSLVQMARYSARRYPTVFLLLMIYSKGLLGGLFIAVADIAVAQLYPWFPVLPIWSLFPLLITSVLCSAFLHVVLFLGRKRGWWTVEADPVPFRPFFRKRSGREDNE